MSSHNFLRGALDQEHDYLDWMDLFRKELRANGFVEEATGVRRGLGGGDFDVTAYLSRARSF
jgi:hypothetical protein